MNITICKNCERYREVEKLCGCNKSKIQLIKFYKNSIIKEGFLTFTTFFKKERPLGCKYVVMKKQQGQNKRKINECINCKEFYISQKRHKCTLLKKVLNEDIYKILSPPDNCSYNIDHEISKLSVSG